MKEMIPFINVLTEYKEYLLEESYAFALYRQEHPNVGNNMTEEEKEHYSVEGFECLSAVVFRLLHSGYGRFIQNYKVHYGVNRLAEGFRNESQLIHFAQHAVNDYRTITETQIDDIEQRLKSCSFFSEPERKSRYYLSKYIMNTLQEHPFPPNRMELLELLRKNENFDEYMENLHTLALLIEPIQHELLQLGETNVDALLKNFRPEEETPTDETYTMVTRKR